MHTKLHLLRSVVAILLLIPFAGQAQTFNGTGGQIPDNGNTAIDFTINVNGLSPNALNATHGLVSVCLNINHTWDSDLQISLIAPDGTNIILADGVGGDQDNFTGTCFNQTASNSIAAGSAPFTGTWKPMGNIGFINNGQNGNGTWKLHVFDQFASDQGSLLNWSITFGNNAPVIVPFTTSELPIVVINTNNQSIPDEPKITANMGIIYNGTGMLNHLTDPYNNYNGKIGIELRGSSSQQFPKKSYGFETRTTAGADTSIAILGMPKESDWVLSANYTDKSLMNNVLAYKLYNNFGSYAPRTRFVEVVLNNQYKGIYVLMEKIKRDTNRVSVHKLSDNDTAGSALTGGYIIKIDKTTGSSGADGFTSTFAPAVSPNGQTIFFQYEYPSADDIHNKQKQYIQRFVDSFEKALHNLPLYDTSTGWRHYADETSFARYLLLNELSKNVDGYRISTYLYKHKDTKGNKLFVGPPWDYDIAFANANYCAGSVDTGWAFNFGNECDGDGSQIPFWWSKLMTDTSFQNTLQCEYSSMRATSLDTTNLFHWIDSTAAFMSNAINRNFDTWPILGAYVWPNPSPVPLTYAGEINELKSWLRRRIAWLDVNIPGTCWPKPPVSNVPGLVNNESTVFPNPFSNELKITMVNSGPCIAKLIAIDGKVVLTKQFTAQQGSTYTITDSGKELPIGLYLLQVQDMDGVWTKKVMKQ